LIIPFEHFNPKFRNPLKEIKIRITGMLIKFKYFFKSVNINLSFNRDDLLEHFLCLGKKPKLDRAVNNGHLPNKRHF
jgi:hypothetical protein